MAQAGQRSGFWRSVRELPERTPLRLKLVTAVLLLVCMALAVISLIGIGVLRNDLLGNVDNSLSQLHLQIERSLAKGIPVGAPALPVVGEAVIWVPDRGSASYLEFPVSASGFTRDTYGRSLPGPNIAGASSLPLNPLDPATVGSISGGLRWRAVGIPATTGSTHGTIVVAVDATSAYRTIGALTILDLTVSLIIVLALALVATAVIRASLKPLTEIEKTAGAIAGGDLSRRVPERDPRTEVGRLGRSLNVMLSQIETAFKARSRSEEAARRSEETMRQFVADASHELRTPLTAIRGFAEYYRQRGGIGPDPAGRQDALPAGQPESLPATQAAESSAAQAAAVPPAVTGPNGTSQLARTDMDRIMRRVEQESARMGVLVEDMLLLARLDQQRPLERQTVDLLTLAADAVHDARVVAPSRSINLTVGSGAALLVVGDEVRLRQVVGNLMSNALSHTPDGTPIDVLIRSGSLDEAPAGAASAEPASAEPASAEPDHAEQAGQPDRTPARSAAVLEVIDHGHGLTREQAEHAFERFYRADHARTSGGTGLGLAIVAALVAAHGGSVWVKSQPGQGATFCIALPLAPEAMQAALDQDAEPDQNDGDPDERGEQVVYHGATDWSGS